MSEHIHTRVVDGVLEMTIDRPARKNALTQAMYTAMADAIGRVEREPGLRVLLITGVGDSFSSGNDIGDFLGMDLNAPESPVLRFLNALANTDAPIVAAVNGRAIGVGVTMLFMCDFVYASDSAVFSTPFVDLALVPEAGSSLTMPAEMGYRRAAEMLLLGESFSAEAMAQAGAINAVLPPGEELDQARTVSARLARKPGRALRASKRLMRPREALQARIQIEIEAFQQALRSPEAQEAMTAFIEKRAPDFSRFD